MSAIDDHDETMLPVRAAALISTGLQFFALPSDPRRRALGKGESSGLKDPGRPL
jgi:hypothetical protein